MDEKVDQQEVEISDVPDSADEPADEFPVRYSPTPIFQFAAFLLATGSIWLATNVWQNPSVISIIIFVGLVAITVGMVFSAFARATYDGETLTYRVPLRPQLSIRRNQIIQVTLEGRRTRALVVGFHPLDENGHIELERAQYVNFVPLQDQWELQEYLDGTRT
jgi:hypothetical protein